MPKPLERSYDGIIIGAGHHGLILGSYLAKAGLKILVIERRLTYGGGLATHEVTEPGFYHNLHSINHFHISETPWFKDLGLDDTVTYITPRYEFGQAHRDGTALVLGRDLDDTVANIARFRRATPCSARGTAARRRSRRAFSCPSAFPSRCRSAGARSCSRRRDGCGTYLATTRGQPLDMVGELFENEHVRLLMLFKISLFGTWLTDTLSKTSPMGSVIRAFDLQTGYQLCQGGSFNLARGLMETFIAAGGTFVPQAHVARVLIQGGRATGIELADGRSVRAGAFVASTLDVHQTFETMIGRAQLPEDFGRKLDRFQYTPWTLFGLHLALHESPRFRAARFDPNIDRALKWSIGADTMEELASAHRDVQADRVPTIVQFGAGPLSLIDPTQAPAGKHTTYAWHVMPLDPDFGGQNEEDFEFAERIIEKWAKYAPNMTRRNIIAQHVYTAREYTQHFPEMRNGDIFMGAFNAEQVMYNHFGYRTPIPNLYLAGSPCHPGGAISGGAGYIAAGLIARDLGIKTWWQPWDARRALEALAEESVSA